MFYDFVNGFLRSGYDARLFRSSVIFQMPGRDDIVLVYKDVI